ncbi:MAG: hypothetical protein IJV33_04870 [Bacteroidaceae bacterium]|nr:hypothetical protein [Bacteroidaceae bacterium]
MRIHKMIMALVLLAFVGKAFADNLTVENVTMSAGETKEVSIALDNPNAEYVAFQFDLVLSEGLSIAKNKKGKLMASLNEDRIDDHTLNVADMGSNTYRFLSFSMTNAEFYEKEGALVYVTLEADETVSEGVKTVFIKSQAFTASNGDQSKWSDFSFDVTIAPAVVPVITAENKTRVYGDENPPLTYTADAEIAGTPELTTSATKASPVGEYEIVVGRGTVEGDFTANNGKLTITKAPLSVSGGTYTIKQGEPLPTFSAVYSGFKNGETEDVLTKKPELSTSATLGSAPGTYDVTVSGAEAGNYAISYVNGTLNIVEADPVVVTVKNYIREYGEENPAFEYTSAGAALTGTPTISCEATATSPVGTYPIVVSKGGVTNYNDSYVNGTLTITKASLTVMAKSYVIKQGEAMPNFDVEYNGFKNNETKDVLTKQPTVTCTATSSTVLGTYEIMASGAEAQNYDISYVAGTLSVIDADAVVVTAKNYTREYGEANPNFEYTSVGAALEGTPTISCEATAASPVGTYPIVVSKGSVKNYNDSYVNGTLTITKAKLQVKPINYYIKQGEPLPVFEASYEGFKNNETEDALKKKPVIGTAATSASSPGVYDIFASGAESDNYEISYTLGMLTITEADPITVTAKSYTCEYGEENPTFEYTSTGKALDGTPDISCGATAASPVGTYPIVVLKGGVKNYNDSYVNGTLTITKAPLTVTAKSYVIKQGEAMPDFEVDYDGFKNDETKDVLTQLPGVTCAAASSEVLGTYEITVSGAEAQNYDISYVYGTLTVIEADAVVVTAKSYTREYGEENPTFEHESSGAALDGTPDISCEATAASPVGTYPIVITKGGVTNYNDSYVNGTLTITKAKLTVAAQSYIIKQGDALPTFEVDYDGFKNGETESVLTKQPTVTCVATSSGVLGTYDIVVSGAEAQNYGISYVNGTLTVVDADAVVVTAKSYTREYGEANPTFEYESSGVALDGTPDISCEATVASPAGTYPIVITKGGVKNYNDSYVNGTLTITKAKLTVRAEDASREQGEENPAFEVSYSGWKLDDDVSSLTEEPDVTCVATKESPVGTYALVVGGGIAMNYEFVYVDGVLTVTIPSGIGGIQTETDDDADWYTLDGRKLNGKPARKGVYIRGGKKVAVK